MPYVSKYCYAVSNIFKIKDLPPTAIKSMQENTENVLIHIMRKALQSTVETVNLQLLC